MPKTNNMDKTLEQLLDLTIKNKASDLHLLAGLSPAIRIDGELMYLNNYPALDRNTLQEMIFSLLKPEQKELLLTNKEI